MSNIDYKIRRAVNNGINDYNSQQQRAQEMHKQRYVDIGILSLVITLLFFGFTIPYKYA